MRLIKQKKIFDIKIILKPIIFVLYQFLFKTVYKYKFNYLRKLIELLVHYKN